jgi:hypothetical protein
VQGHRIDKDPIHIEEESELGEGSLHGDENSTRTVVLPASSCSRTTCRNGIIRQRNIRNSGVNKSLIVDISTSGEPIPRKTKQLWVTALRRPFKYLLFGLAALILLGLVAPFISVGLSEAQIQRSLEASLGRRVQLGKVHYTLFAGPGFSIDKVTIGEDPRYGIEPCAYVPNLVATVRLDKLLTGKLQFAELRLTEPTLNLVKRGDGTWNIVEVVERLGQQGANSWNFLPAIQVSDARLNFKFGERKSMFYLNGAEIAAYPDTSGKVRIQFSGSPSRTDRSGPGFGLVRGGANWYLQPTTSGSNKLEADLTLEQSNLSEAITLIEGYDIGVHGTISSHLVISGPEQALTIQGDVHLQDVHRWDLLPASGEDWHVRYRGSVDLMQHKIQLETIPASSDAPTPVVLQVRVNDFLTRPSWSVLAQLRHAPAQNLLPLAERMGLGLPPGLSAKGNVDGAVGYSNRSGWNGGLALTQVSASLPNSPTLVAPLTTINIGNDHVHIFPSPLEIQSGASVQITGDYVPSSRALNISLLLANSPVSSFTETLGSLFGAPPFFPALQGGMISGQLRYRHALPDEPEWAGEFQLTRASLQPPGLALPVRNLSAHVALADNQLNISRFAGLIGDTPITGDYRYNLRAAHKERIALQAASLDLADLEKVLSPALGPQDFFSRFRFGKRSQPGWLTARSLEGDASVQHLSLDGADLGAFKVRFQWVGPNIQITSLQAALPEGQVRGHGSVSLANVRPRYSLSGELVDYPWKGGFLDLNGDLSTGGIGTEALLNLRASGRFSGTGISASPENTFSRLSGNYILSFESGWPRVQLSKVQAEQAEEVWEGTGTSEKNGSLVLDLASGARQMRVLSTLDPSPALTSPLAAAHSN